MCIFEIYFYTPYMATIRRMIFIPLVVGKAINNEKIV